MGGGNPVRLLRMTTPYGVLSASRGTRGGAMAMHRHREAHVVFVLRGTMREGECADRARTWTSGQVVLFPADWCHATWFAAGETLVASLRLRAGASGQLGLGRAEAMVSARIGEALCAALASALVEASERGGANGKVGIFGLIEEALLALHAGDARDDWLEAVRRRLESDCAEPPPLDELAQLAGRNASYVSHAFGRRFGVTISQYVRRHRVLRAAGLLADPSTSLTEVAYAAGFADSAHFANAFRQYSSASASRFRRVQAVTRDVDLSRRDPN